MCSFFENGITNTYKSKNVDFPWIVNYIKNNPQTTLINWIRELRKQGNHEYKKLKSQLNYITPNCVVKERKLTKVEDFNLNFILMSGYIYIDIDTNAESDEYKEYFIKRYGHLASLVCKSSSGYGISVFFKITNPIESKEDFELVWNNLRYNILGDEDVDINCKDIGRAMFLSYDADVYCNYENINTIELSNTIIHKKIVKGTKQGISNKKYNNTLIYTFSNLPDYDEFINKVVTSTQVNVINPIVDINPIEFVKCSFPNRIRDGSKHNVFGVLIHKLVYLNPKLDIRFLFAYINFINNNYTTMPMEFRELCRHFLFVYSLTQEDGYVFNLKKIKSFHINNAASLSKEIKMDVMNKLNGIIRSNKSIEKIQNAKAILKSQGKKITQKSVSEVSGLSIGTRKNHYKSDLVDIEDMLETINDSIPSHNTNDYKEFNEEVLEA